MCVVDTGPPDFWQVTAASPPLGIEPTMEYWVPGPLRRLTLPETATW